MPHTQAYQNYSLPLLNQTEEVVEEIEVIEDTSEKPPKIVEAVGAGHPGLGLGDQGEESSCNLPLGPSKVIPKQKNVMEASKSNHLA